MSGDVGVEHFAFLLFLLPHIYPVLIGGAAQTRARAFPVSLCYSGTIDLGCERGLGEFCESTDGSSSKLGVIQRKSIVQAESSPLSLSLISLSRTIHLLLEAIQPVVFTLKRHQRETVRFASINVASQKRTNDRNTITNKKGELGQKGWGLYDRKGKERDRWTTRKTRVGGLDWNEMILAPIRRYHHVRQIRCNCVVVFKPRDSQTYYFMISIHVFFIISSCLIDCTVD